MSLASFLGFLCPKMTGNVTFCVTVHLRCSAGPIQVIRIRPLKQVYDDFIYICNFVEIINKTHIAIDAEVVPVSSNILVMIPAYTYCSIY